MTEYYGRPGGFADLLDETMPTETLDWWEEAARRAVKYFPDKVPYMAWVYDTYGGDDNRFTASVCWDIIKLEQSQDGNGSG